LEENATAEAYESAFKQYCDSQAVKSGELLQPLRLAVSGFGVGAPIWEMIALIGRDYIVPRIQKAVTKISFPKA
jgi:glutamyl-tRNA synthetase